MKTRRIKVRMVSPLEREMNQSEELRVFCDDVKKGAFDMTVDIAVDAIRGRIIPDHKILALVEGLGKNPLLTEAHREKILHAAKEIDLDQTCRAGHTRGVSDSCF